MSSALIHPRLSCGVTVWSTSSVVQRAAELAARPQRTLLGVVGPPGSGKSALAEQIAATVGDGCRVVGMDGFHLAQVELARLGRADRKGAPDTFDVDGYVALLRRLRAADEPVVYAPLFRRDIEEPVAGAVAVPAAVPLVITEGNYLLLWPGVRELLDETWYLDVDGDERRRRLVTRRMELGSDEADARRWAFGSDESNAQIIAGTRGLADVVVTQAS